MAKIIINHEGEKYPIANVIIESIDANRVSFKMPRDKFSTKQVFDYTRTGVLKSVSCYHDDHFSASVEAAKVEDIAD